MKLFISRRDRRGAFRIRRLFFSIPALALVLSAEMAAAQAPSSESGEPAWAQPEMQPQAVDALKKLGAYLMTLRSFRIDADSVTDAVLTTGQNVGFLHHTQLLVQRPNRVRAVLTGTRAPKGMVYDGHSFVLFNDADKYYSKVPAPPTIDALITDIDAKYGVGLPLVDLFYWGQRPDDEKSLTSAIFVGLDKVDGKWCRHYAYQQPGLDWELWMESGARPLPCRFVVTDTTQASRPQHAINYHWTLEPKFSPATFAYHPGPGTEQIPLRPADASSDQSTEAK